MPFPNSYKIIHAITSRIPGSWHKKLAFIYHRYASITLLKEKGVKVALCEIFLKKYTNRSAYRKRLERLADIRKKDTITVVFQVWNLAKWKSDTVYREMDKNSRFNPLIWITDEPSATAQEKIRLRNKLETYFKGLNYRYSYATSIEELKNEHSPDIIFIQEPYEDNWPAISAALNGELLCFVSYYITHNVSKAGLNHFLFHSLLIHFVENKHIQHEIKALLKHRVNNMVPVGHPIFDYLREGCNSGPSVWKQAKCGLKKIIWAPHWTIENNSFYSNGVFLEICHDMLHIAQQYSDKIQIAFKPHPTLYRTLCNHSEWGQEKTDAYYRLWETMPNTQLETSGYKELFWQSDAMIHDCGSFIIEYPIVNKPCMYLQRGSGYSEFNATAKAALSCYTIGKTAQDIETFIIQQVLNENDPKKEIREQFIQEYLSTPNGKSAAQNIIDTLLTLK